MLETTKDKMGREGPACPGSRSHSPGSDAAPATRLAAAAWSGAGTLAAAIILFRTVEIGAGPLVVSAWLMLTACALTVWRIERSP